VGKGKAMKRKGKGKLDFYAFLCFIYRNGVAKNTNIAEKVAEMVYSVVVYFGN